MKRFEKIVLEQTRKSKPGTIGQTVSTDAVNQKAKQLKAISFLLYYVFGKKESPIDKQKVASVLPRISIYGDNSIYSRGEYFYVVGEDYKENEGTNKAVIYFPIYIIRQIESDIEILNKFRIGGTDKAPIIDINDFQNIQDVVEKKKADAEAIKTVASKELEKQKPTVKKPKIVVQNVVKGTETIDVNNLGKGTPDAKAFQELLYQVGLKYVDAGDRGPTTVFGKFAKWRTKGSDGGWDGDIGPATLNMLDKLGLKDKYKSGDKAGVIKDLRDGLKTNESTNYFKGIGMNLKLKDLLREQIKVKSDAEVFGGTRRRAKTTSATKKKAVTTKKKPSLTNFTPDTLPDNYTGKGKLTYGDGHTFTGSWENGKKSGQGTIKSKGGTTYNGTFANGKMTGEFTTEYSNGNIRVGTYNSNGLNGTVTFTPKGGEPVQETWKDGKKLLDIEDLYKKSVADTEDILLKLINYVNNHSQFDGYKAFDDDEAAALKDLVKPWVQSNIQPKVTNHYNKYIKPYMDMYNVPDNALNVEYDLEFVGTNNSVTNIPNDKFRKIIQNYLILKANSSNTALNHPTRYAAYYNYAGDQSSYTIPCMFYYNYERSVHYWNLAGGRAAFNVDTDF